MKSILTPLQDQSDMNNPVPNKPTVASVSFKKSTCCKHLLFVRIKMVVIKY